MKALLAATLIGLALLGTPLALISTPATYACGTSCNDGRERTAAVEVMPAWIDCGTALECLRF